MTDMKDRLIEWLLGNDTGLSSKYMAAVCLGVGIHTKLWPHYPLDPSDFGLCYRFLRAVPEARENLDKLKDSGPVWAAYVDNWRTMERLYEEEMPTGQAPKLYALMQRIRRECGE